MINVEDSSIRHLLHLPIGLCVHELGISVVCYYNKYMYSNSLRSIKCTQLQNKGEDNILNTWHTITK